MKMKRLALATITMVAALGMSKVALSDSGLSYTFAGSKPDDVTAQVKFKVTIPKIMILRIGDWGKDASSVNEVSWVYDLMNKSGSLSDQAAAQADWVNAAKRDVMAAKDDAADGTDGLLDVYAFSNAGGDTKITAALTEFERVASSASSTVATGANQPKLSDISVAIGGSNIQHAAFGSAATQGVATITAVNGIVNKTDTWTYSYTPDATPVAGEYNATVVYTMAAL